MPLVEGNTRLIYIAEQTAKGSVAAVPTQVFELSGDGALNPNRELITLPETDGSTQRADNQVVGSSPGGGWTSWVRDSQFQLLAEGILGTIATAPAGTHTATPSKVLPYYTVWDVIPGKQCTRYDDARFSQLTISGEAMQGIPVAVQMVALSALLGVAEPTLTRASDLKYSYPLVKVTVGGAWPKTHDAFSVTINRNVSILRGDSFGLSAFDSHAGLFEVSGTLRKIYETDADYRKIHGGSAAATTLTKTIFTEALDILMEQDSTHSIQMLSSGIEYTEITVPVNVDGTPILQTLTFNTKRQATWADNFKMIVKFP